MTMPLPALGPLWFAASRRASAPPSLASGYLVMS
jgi:hypothetical protein